MGGWIVGTSTDDSGRAVCRADRLARLRYQTFAEQGRGEGKGARGGGGVHSAALRAEASACPGQISTLSTGSTRQVGGRKHRVAALVGVWRHAAALLRHA